jgi:hypothetical protein
MDSRGIIIKGEKIMEEMERTISKLTEVLKSSSPPLRRFEKEDLTDSYFIMMKRINCIV